MNIRKLARAAVRRFWNALRPYLATYMVVAIMDDGKKRKVHYCFGEREALEWVACYSRHTSCYVYRMLPQDMSRNLVSVRYAC